MVAAVSDTNYCYYTIVSISSTQMQSQVQIWNIGLLEPYGVKGKPTGLQWSERKLMGSL